MADRTCPECGQSLPGELGQHSTAPLSGLVSCPNCGAEVHLDKPAAGAPGGEGRIEPAGATEGDSESFSGHETVEGVMQEVEDKQQQ
ncbi:MAG: hypothetical protein H0W55_01290 [Actinobacteria bacterium]|nr:hypothetical protein [Actinomycetota bacterium]